MIVMIIVGGLGSISGAIIGGIFVAVSLELMRDLAQYRLVLYALLLIVIMIVRPQGLLGTRELFDVFKKRNKPPGPTSTPTESA
jgi:branched-chain amino acid transport system permease protein